MMNKNKFKFDQKVKEKYYVADYFKKNNSNHRWIWTKT